MNGVGGALQRKRETKEATEDAWAYADTFYVHMLSINELDTAAWASSVGRRI